MEEGLEENYSTPKNEGLPGLQQFIFSRVQAHI
jgi:hypothetical protein